MRTRTYVALAAGIGLLGAVYVPGCGNDTHCGAGTTEVDGVCIPNGEDMSVQVDLAGTTLSCGTNTQPSADGTACEVAAGACLNGTVYDPAAKNCHIPNDFGTEVFTSYSTSTWFNMARINPMPPDGGSMYQTLGALSGGINVAGVQDTDLLFLSKAPFYPFGLNTNIPIIWGDGTINTTRTAIDHQITVGEFKKCVGVFHIYKNPPEAVALGKKEYKEVLDVSGCPPDLTMSIWNIFSKSELYSDRTISTLPGGLPHMFITNGAGQGHWERNVDPEIWFKSGAAVTGTAHAANVNSTLPDLTAFPNATMGPYLMIHNFHMTNGNAGFCEKDPNAHTLDGNSIAPNTLCKTPASPNILLPGQNGYEVAITHYFFAPATGQEAYCSAPAGAACAPVPMSMIQPF